LAEDLPVAKSDQRDKSAYPADPVAYFCNVAMTARGNCVNDVVYIEFNEAEKRAYPQLAECYGIAIQLQPTDSEKVVQWFLFQTESEFDDDVLNALSGLPAPQGPPLQ
jgi:hypothetical protein